MNDIMRKIMKDGKIMTYPATISDEQRKFNEVAEAYNRKVDEEKAFKKEIQERAGGIVGRCNSES